MVSRIIINDFHFHHNVVMYNVKYKKLKKYHYYLVHLIFLPDATDVPRFIPSRLIYFINEGLQL